MNGKCHTWNGQVKVAKRGKLEVYDWTWDRQVELIRGRTEKVMVTVLKTASTYSRKGDNLRPSDRQGDIYI